MISTLQSLLWGNGRVVVEVNNTYALFGNFDEAEFERP